AGADGQYRDVLQRLAEIAHRLGDPDEDRIVGPDAPVDVAVGLLYLERREENRRRARRGRHLPDRQIAPPMQVRVVVVLEDSRKALDQLVARHAHWHLQVFEHLVTKDTLEGVD